MGLLRIGVEDADDIGGELNPGRFSFVDGLPDKASVLETEVVPWAKNQPSDLNEEKSCVEWRPNGLFGGDPDLWNDESCTSVRHCLCRRLRAQDI